MNNVTRTLTKKEMDNLAGMLPQVAPLTCEKHWVDGSELIAQGHLEDQDGVRFIAGIKYEQNFPVVMAVNHRRNIKKIFKKHGDQGVLTYINEVQKHKIINDEIASKA